MPDAALSLWHHLTATAWVSTAAMAIFAAYVALDLARGILSSHRPTAWRSLLGAAFALALGVCASPLLLSAAEPLAAQHRYPRWPVFGVLVFTYCAALIILWVAVVRRPRALRTAAGGLLLGAVTLAVPLLLMQLLAPGLTGRQPTLATAGAAACVLAALGWWLFTYRPRHATLAGLSLAQTSAAGLMGLAMLVGNAGVAMAISGTAFAAPPAPGTGVSGDALRVLAALGVPSLLALLLLSSILESRFKTMLRRARDELQVAADTDPLTQLPNRAMFERELARATQRADRGSKRLAVLLVNLDGFQAINESLGQSSGDALLRTMAERLRNIVGAKDVAARAGGDEFLLLLDHVAAGAEVAQFANRLIKALHLPCHLEEREVVLSCSVGMALYPDHGALPKLIAHAAAAMQEAKRNGGAACCFFEPRMVEGAREQIDLLRDLRHAITHNELELYYQPKVHAPSGQITGAEALMRWHHPTRGMVGPVIFIPLAERFGLINALGNWLIEDVCRQIRTWLDQGLRMRVAINLSVHQLRQPDLVERITGALKRHNVEPSLLTCELTESAAMEDARVTSHLIEQLTAAGVHLSIDDFGTGYSSLSYLRELAAEELKIDRSFVLDLEHSADARAIVDAVVKLAQALGMKVVAEGVETEAQGQILRSLGCNELQGYLYAKPMAAQSLTLWAMHDEGPRTIDFRPSLFATTLSGHE